MAGTAMARGGYGGCMQGQGQMFNQLTPEKQQQVKAIFDKHENELQTVRTQLWAKRTELNALVASGKADQKTISGLVKEMTDLKTKQYNLRNQVNAEIEKTTGISMPMRGFGGHRFDNDGPGRGRHHNSGPRGGGCPYF